MTSDVNILNSLLVGDDEQHVHVNMERGFKKLIIHLLCSPVLETTCSALAGLTL